MTAVKFYKLKWLTREEMEKMNNDGWTYGHEENGMAVPRLILECGGFDNVERQTFDRDKQKWLQLLHPYREIILTEHFRYRRKQRKLAAPWQEIDPDKTYSDVIIAKEKGKGLWIESSGLRAKPELLIEKGYKYWMPLSALPPIFEDEK